MSSPTMKWVYVQQAFGSGDWKPTLACNVDTYIATHNPALITVLSTDAVGGEDRAKVRYLGPLYFDWDCADLTDAIVAFQTTLTRLASMGVNLNSTRMYATGGRGFHLEIPMETFLLPVPKTGITYLPAIYREIAFELATEGLDLTIYSMGRGRMWRVPNVVRDNGKFKVGITLAEAEAMTPELYEQLTSKMRPALSVEKPEACPELMQLFDSKQTALKERIAKLKPAKKELLAKLKTMTLPSVEALLRGEGIKSDAGFQTLAVQLSVLAVSMDWTADDLVSKARGLIETHESDSSRYATVKLRERELRRMYNYMQDNPCYTFTPYALRSILTHSAPDLDGVKVTAEEIEEAIATAEVGADADTEDVCGSVVVNQRGVWSVGGEQGPMRLSAVSFQDVTEMRTMGSEDEGGKTLAFDAEVMANGVPQGRATIPVQAFASLQNLNKVTSAYGYSIGGTDVHARQLMNRLKQLSDKREGGTRWAVTTEGLSLCQIPLHPDPDKREPFTVWADAHRVLTGDSPSFARELGLKMPTGKTMLHCDLMAADSLADLVKDEDKKGRLHQVLEDLLMFQEPKVVSRILGWCVACFYKPYLVRVEQKFPLMQVYGEAGAGKTETMLNMLRFFYYRSEPPQPAAMSTIFSLQQYLAASQSVAVMLDEYKPHVLSRQRHEELKAMFRDVYNAKTVTRGGGNAPDQHYTVINQTTLSAPLFFMSEAPEMEPAIMERAISVNLRKPTGAYGTETLLRHTRIKRDTWVLSALGKYMVQTIMASMNLDQFKAEFMPLLEAVNDAELMPTDGRELPSEEVARRIRNQSRTVYNHAVVLFGLKKLKGVYQDIYEDQFETRFGARWTELESSVFTGMNDTSDLIIPEWAQVLQALSAMSNSREPDILWALEKGKDYVVESVGGMALLTINPVNCYNKYRAYCARMNATALYASAQAFQASIRSASAVASAGPSRSLSTQFAISFWLDKLASAHVESFRP